MPALDSFVGMPSGSAKADSFRALVAGIRSLLDQNPSKHIRRLKVPAREVRVFSEKQRSWILEAGRAPSLDRELLVVMALCTGMRRGELLNTTQAELDLTRLTISVSLKKNDRYTCEWRLKDSEWRTLPLTEDIVPCLLVRRAERPQLHPCD